MKTDIWSRLLRFWPVILAGGLILIAGVETRIQVSRLVSDRQVDIKQWELIRKQGHKIVDHERRLQDIEQHMTPQAIQRWGQIQATVDEDHRRLEEHLRGH